MQRDELHKISGQSLGSGLSRASLGNAAKSAIGLDAPVSARALGQIISSLQNNEEKLGSIAQRVHELRARILGATPENETKHGEVYNSCVNGDLNRIANSQDRYLEEISVALNAVESWV